MNYQFRHISLKGIFLLFIAILASSVVSCEKEVNYTQMFQFYEESIELPDATVDSIKSFNTKFSSYVIKNPESRQDEYFEPTVANVRHAADINGISLTDLRIVITIDTTWDRDTTIYY